MVCCSLEKNLTISWQDEIAHVKLPDVVTRKKEGAGVGECNVSTGLGCAQRP